MFKKASIALVAAIFSGMLLFGGVQLAYAQSEEPILYEEPSLYEDTTFDDLYEDDLYYEWDSGEEFSWTFFVITLLCAVLPAYIFMGLVLSTLGKKVGETPTWMAWVPVLNMYYFVKVSGLPGWTFILFLVPFVNFFYQVYVWMKIAGRRGFEEWYGILTLVPFVNFVIILYLTWGTPKGGDVKQMTEDTVAKVEDVKDEVVEKVESATTDKPE